MLRACLELLLVCAVLLYLPLQLHSLSLSGPKVGPTYGGSMAQQEEVNG